MTISMDSATTILGMEGRDQRRARDLDKAQCW